jgi:hypothetical protein
MKRAHSEGSQSATGEGEGASESSSKRRWQLLRDHSPVVSMYHAIRRLMAVDKEIR